MTLKRRALLALIIAGGLKAQTTQGLISGQVLNAATGLPIADATVSWKRPHASDSSEVRSDPRGRYTLPLLSPDIYELRASADGFQPQVVAEQRLEVASRIDVTFRLRPQNDTAGTNSPDLVETGNQRLIHFYAADLESLKLARLQMLEASTSNLNATLSYVIDSSMLSALPLAGRDAYALLVVLPGVTSDSGTLRGLGYSVNGQRPTASNFLLDGLETNNELATGNLFPVAPEEIREYRISTSNFSAEYGRTTGFLANAITAPGTSAWHGSGYLYFKNDVLNANGARHPTLGLENYPLPRLPLKEFEPGMEAGGTLGGGWFVSIAGDFLSSHSQLDPQLYRLPSTLFLQLVAPGSPQAALMSSLQAPHADDTQALVVLNAPARRSRYSAVPRVDRQFGSSTRLFFRAAAGGTAFPDFIWSPYTAFTSPLYTDAAAPAIGLTTTGSITNEARVGWTWDRLALVRTQPDIPALSSTDDDLGPVSIKTLLPGSQAPYDFRNRNRTWQILDNVSWTRYRHLPRIGGGVILRHLDGALNYLAAGYFNFANLIDFAAGKPDEVQAVIASSGLPAQQLVNTNRNYSWTEYYAFAQDSFRLRPGLTLDYGLRYEYLGVPENTGVQKDSLVTLGTGDSFIARLSGAKLVQPSAGTEPLYNPDRNNFAPRAGFSWRPTEGPASVVFRGSFGIFYDRPFDNLWLNIRNNDLAYGTAKLNSLFPTNFLSIAQVLSQTRLTIQNGAVNSTLIQPGLRDGYVESYFFGIEKPVTSAWYVEAHVSGALGHKLLTTDIINRDFSLPLSFRTSDNPRLRYDPGLGQINYVSNQGTSEYNALTAVARYRTARWNLQASYTWSHNIDIQTDPLAGEFFNLGFTNPVLAGGAEIQPAQFTRQFDSHGERGNSDFDQRHNFTVISYWDIPYQGSSRRLAALLRNWHVAEVAAFRSGFPYTVYAPVVSPLIGDPILINRANLQATGGSIYLHQPVNGGVRLFDPGQFKATADGSIGNTGRNEFRGPGLYNVDASLSRSFVLPHLGDAGRLTLRADAFNLLNHANLNNPNSVMSSPQFSIALAGRQDVRTGFPGSIPLDETGRQIQLSVRVTF